MSDHLPWTISDPDDDGNVWLQWTDMPDLLLGPRAAVGECFSDWLCRCAPRAVGALVARFEPIDA